MQKSLPDKKIPLSIVIPCYNEGHRIGKTIEAVINWARTRDLFFELIIADDGSTDETLNRVKNYQGLISNLQVLSLPHQGKGAAVRSGMLASRGGRDPVYGRRWFCTVR